jgi:hypothetical protein
LQKKGEHNSAWKKRFFIMKENALSYFANPKDPKPKVWKTMFDACRIIALAPNDIALLTSASLQSHSLIGPVLCG